MKIKKILAGALAAGALLLFVAFPAFAACLADVQTPPTDVLSAANSFAKKLGMLDRDFFVETNDKGDALRYGDLHLLNEDKINYLVWGPWHSDPNWDGDGGTKPDDLGMPRARYLGYGYYGESVSNMLFPPDRPGGWQLFDTAGLVAEPWLDSAVGQAFPQFFGPVVNRFDGTNDPDLLDSMRTGLLYSFVSNEYDFDTESDLFQNPQKYVHVFLPPSPETFGAGVMFHRDPDGSLYYMSVILAYAGQRLDLDDAISLDPPERTGKPGDPASFTLKVSWKGCKILKQVASELGYDSGFLVQVSHRVNGSLNAAAFTLDGAQSQDAGNGWAQVGFVNVDDASKTGTVTVHVQNTPSEVVAQIVPYVKDRETGYVFLWTDVYLYKQARANVKVEKANLKVVDITLAPNPGEPGQPTSGKIIIKNESEKAFSNVKVIWRVRHSDGTVLDENTITTDFAAGEVKFLPFSFTPDTADTYSVAAMVNPDHDNPPNEVNWLTGDWPGDNC